MGGSFTRCETCKGYGRKPYPKSFERHDPCPACGGKGYFDLTKPEEKLAFDTQEKEAQNAIRT